MSDFDTEIQLTFLDEALEYVENAEQILLQMTEAQATDEHLSTLFRVAHNLKGSGQSVGFHALADFTHKIENVIAALKDKKLVSTPHVVSALIEANDNLKAFICALKVDLKATYDTVEIEAKLKYIIENKGEATTAPAQAAPTPEEATSSEEESESSDHIPGPGDSLQAAEKLPEKLHDLTRANLKVVSTAPTAATAEKAEKKEEGAKQHGQSEQIKVSLSKLDNTLNSIGELVVYQNMLNQARKALSTEEFDYLNSVVSRLNVIVRDIQLSSFSLRMMPIGGVFNKMKRIVRDLSHKLDKAIDFKIEGEHIELDKSVVEGIADPLTHLIRNALDHGVETREERAKTDKPPVATVRLSAKKEADYVSIEIQDDGKGLMKERILAKAREKGLLRGDESLREEDIFRLIFQNGFSTKENVTEISGRGVGMDVVRSHVEGLGGEINIKSVEGKGTTFQVLLPQSMAIIDGMVCEVNQDRYIIPISNLHETLQIERGQLGMVNQRSYTVRIRQEELPFYSLEDLLANKRTTAPPGESFFGIVSVVNGKKYCFKVSRLIGVQQIVVKPLGLEFSVLPGLAGSAVLGDGSAGLILDLLSLVNEKVIKVAGAAA